MKIAVAGLGYVGLSLAVLLAQADTVLALDVSPARVDLVNREARPSRTRISPRSWPNAGWT